MSHMVQEPFVKVTVYLALSIRLTDMRVCAMSGVVQYIQRVMFKKLGPFGMCLGKLPDPMAQKVH